MTTNWNPFSAWNQLKRNHNFSYFWIKADWNTIPNLFVCNLVLTIFRLIRNSCCWINYCYIPKYNSQVKTTCLIETMWVINLHFLFPDQTSHEHISFCLQKGDVHRKMFSSCRNGATVSIESHKFLPLNSMYRKSLKATTNYILLANWGNAWANKVFGWQKFCAPLFTLPHVE